MIREASASLLGSSLEDSEKLMSQRQPKREVERLSKVASMMEGNCRRGTKEKVKQEGERRDLFLHSLSRGPFMPRWLDMIFWVPHTAQQIAREVCATPFSNSNRIILDVAPYYI